MNRIPRGWVPVDGGELWEDRGWDIPEIERRIRSGNLCDVMNEYGRHIYESPEQHRRYMHLRKRMASEYEASERYHATHTWNGEYGRARDLCYGNGMAEVSLWRRIWRVFCVVVEILAIPLTILGMRNGAQWFLGTGEYGENGG